MFRTLVAALSVCAGLMSSQAPEFAVQYQHRLGGAIGELEPIVSNFDADAHRADLTRAEALAVYGRSHEQFLKDRGKSMAQVFDRYDHLVAQRDALSASGNLMRPVRLLSSVDERIFTDTRREFSPAVPLTLAGLVYAALGALAASMLAALLRGLVGRARSVLLQGRA